jgi:SEC-C motif-containing protein
LASERNPRGVDGSLLEAWKHAEEALTSFLDGLDATENAHTTAVVLLAVEIQDPTTFFDDRLRGKSGANEAWTWTETQRESDGQWLGVALPVRRGSPDAPVAAPFVDIHTRLIAWWLCYAWRARQLAHASALLADADQVVAAAACARPLLETAAAFWFDARNLASAWDAAKQAGAPGTEEGALTKRHALTEALNEVQFGGLFDKRADQEKVVHAFERTHVLKQLEKLAKATSADLQTDYQWLCNTVHPSVGNTFAFGVSDEPHPAGTHRLIGFAGKQLPVSSNEDTEAGRLVQAVTARAVSASLRILTATFDAALHVVDDLGLTTRAPTVATFPYWRALRTTNRNDPCPCRSGRKVKHCVHAWGLPGPAIPESFRDLPAPPLETAAGAPRPD